jgi:hypothetical protein
MFNALGISLPLALLALAVPARCVSDHLCAGPAFDDQPQITAWIPFAGECRAKGTTDFPINDTAG